MGEVAMSKAHILAFPYPAQGHVIPMLELCQCLAENGIKITFLNTEFNHTRIVKSLSHKGNISKLINLACIPDGLEPGEDRNDLGKLTEVMKETMPEKLEILIKKMNETESGERIGCVLTEHGIGWATTVSKKLGVQVALFLPAPVALLSQGINAMKLVDDGIIDNNGTPLKKEMFKLSPDMPEMNPAHLAWACIGDLASQKKVFEAIAEVNETIKLADCQLCNSSYELEPGALALLSKCMPVGPLLASNRLGKSAGHFWPEDYDCLSWLDKQPAQSVIYVAFGSFTVFDQTQFQELAIGLELTNMPFLWVVRPDITENINEAYPSGYEDRVKNRGKMVGWAPQQKVLSHPSIGCFLTHCGWNSTTEGISNGIPLLCWPYFADQFLNENYITHLWKIGLGFEKDENEIIRQEEIKDKVELLLGDEGYKARTLELQAKVLSCVSKGGSSERNLSNFVDWIKKN